MNIFNPNQSPRTPLNKGDDGSFGHYHYRTMATFLEELSTRTPDGEVVIRDDPQSQGAWSSLVREFINELGYSPEDVQSLKELVAKDLEESWRFGVELDCLFEDGDDPFRPENGPDPYY